MGIRFADGFEHYGTGATSKTNMLAGAGYAAFGASENGVSSAVARTGSRSLELADTSPSGAGVRLVFPGAAAQEIGIGFGAYLDALPGTNQRQGVQFRDATNTNLVTLSYATDGSIQVFSGGTNGTLLGSTAPLLTASAFNHIECKVLHDPVVGRVELRINGVPELILEDINTGTNPCAQFGFGNVYHVSTGSTNTTVFMDDLIIWDTEGLVNNDFMGPVQVITVFPAATEAGVMWLPTGAATAHECVDETTPDGDTTVIVAENTGDVVEFTLPALPPELISVSGIVVPIMAKAESAGIANYQASVVSGVDEALGANNPLTTAYTYRPDIFETNPETGGGWSVSAVQDVKIKITRVEPVE